MAFQNDAYSKTSFAEEHGAKLRRIGIAAVAVLILAGIALFWFDPFQSALSITREGDEAAIPEADLNANAPRDGTASAQQIVVFVSGAVKSPDVYELDEGSRVLDAIEKAGGFNDEAEKESLNLARVLIDGEQIVVPTQGAVEPSEEGATQDARSTQSDGVINGKVNINRASAEELQSLTGVGEATARKIIADREANGPFATPEDLMRVSGIGEKKFAAMADSITVG